MLIAKHIIQNQQPISLNFDHGTNKLLEKLKLNQSIKRLSTTNPHTTNFKHFNFSVIGRNDHLLC